MEEIKKLTEAVTAQGQQIENLSTAISGNERFGQRGMKHDVQDLRDEIKALKDQAKGELRRIIKWVAISSAISSIFTVGAIKLGLGKIIAIFIKLLG